MYTFSCELIKLMTLQVSLVKNAMIAAYAGKKHRVN